MRLIPKADELGWTPYAWLVYLGIFWFACLVDEPTPTDWFLAALGTALFLPLYFWGYWLPGRKALVAVAGITLLGILFAPINWGSSVFFVYAAGHLGYVGSAAFAFRLLLALAALPPLEAWLLDLSAFFWIPAMVFSLLIGGINIHYAGVRRSQAALRRTQEEVERLAKLAERERIARDLHDLLGHGSDWDAGTSNRPGRRLEGRWSGWNLDHDYTACHPMLRHRGPNQRPATNRAAARRLRRRALGS